MHTSFCVTGVSGLTVSVVPWTLIHFPGFRLPAAFRALRPARAVKRSLLDGAEDRSMLGGWAGSASSFGYCATGLG